MQDVLKEAKQLLHAIKNVILHLNISGLESELTLLHTKTSNPKLWENQTEAQTLLKQQSRLEQRIKSWRDVEKSTNEVIELAESGDESLTIDLEKQLKQTKTQFEKLKIEQ